MITSFVFFTCNSSNKLPIKKFEYVCAYCRTKASLINERGIGDGDGDCYCSYCGGPDESVLVGDGAEFF